MQLQVGTCSLNARSDAWLLMAGAVPEEDCHSLCVLHEPGICAFLFTAIIGRRVIHSMEVYENMLL